MNLLGNNISCWNLYPAANCLGAALSYSSGAGALGILVPPTFMPPVLMQEGGDKDMFLMSIGGTLYLGVNTNITVIVNDGKDSYEQTRDVTEVYNLDITANSIARGSKICTAEPQIFSGDGQAIISTGETLTWWSGNDNDGAKVNTLNPTTGVVTSRSLPAHYPSFPPELLQRPPPAEVGSIKREFLGRFNVINRFFGRDGLDNTEHALHRGSRTNDVRRYLVLTNSSATAWATHSTILSRPNFPLMRSL